jgi:hypothetical protein
MHLTVRAPWLSLPKVEQCEGITAQGINNNPITTSPKVRQTQHTTKRKQGFGDFHAGLILLEANLN